MVTHSKWFWPAALLTAWFADFLFWGRAPGVSFPIWIIAVLAVGFLLSWREGRRASLWTVLLSVLTIFYAAATAFRTNGMVNFGSLVMVAGGLILIAATFLNGNWVQFRMVDYLVEGLKVVWAAFRGRSPLLPCAPLPEDGQPDP